MTRTVLADTGPLYAAVDPDDQHHERAQGQLGRLEDEGLSVALPFPTLLEAYTLILYRLGNPTTSRWLKDGRCSGASLLNPSPQDYREAAELTGRFPDPAISLFDATLAILATRLELPVWTYDHHFDVMPINVWR